MIPKFSKYVYLAFVLVGCFYLVQKSIGSSMIYLGLALAFDPFNPEEAWKDRPNWQKLILLVHLAIVFGLIFIEIFNSFF
jgi:hypothetical protein